MRRTLVPWLFTPLVAGALACCAPTRIPAPAPALSAQAPAQVVARVRAVFDSAVAAGGYPGATLGVVLRDGSSFGMAAGWSDTVARQPMRPDHLLLSGSTGKTYVAAVALQLMAEGRLRLDDPISRWLGAEPWFARVDNGEAVTVRHLMTHTSGLVRYEFNPRFVEDLNREPGRTWTPEQRLAYLFDTPAPFRPGAGWEYSDTNYIVLGMIIERITGRPLNDEIRARVLRPLRLAGTVPSDRPRIAGLSQGYAGPRNPFGGRDAMVQNGALVINPQFEWAGGGYATTAHDLARWGKMMYEGRAYPLAWRDSAVQGVEAPGLGQGARYGLGVIIRPTPLGITWGHAGFMPGYLTEVRYWPDLGISVAVQVNSSSGRSPAPVVNAVAAAVAAIGREPDQLARRGAELIPMAGHRASCGGHGGAGGRTKLLRPSKDACPFTF
ncbi:MAG TPA: serine hydrolase domain-containing protein [Longimicrobium sp.]|uniref:serine hydrolase domain-containing protein n=1 Tax=Longimicrobium sp. TaxID=2029185 RepID=UPI002ED8F391